MELYKQIKRYRTDMNLSQEELAEKIYVTRQTISNWENDKSYPDIHSLLLLSSTFHISLDQLINTNVEVAKKLTGVLTYTPATTSVADYTSNQHTAIYHRAVE